jgi:hypothetical protein
MLPATVALVSSAFSGTQRGIAISTPPSTPDSATILSRRHTGSIPKLFDPLLSPYLDAARTASAWGIRCRISRPHRARHRRRQPRIHNLEIEEQRGLRFRVICR